MKYCQPFPTAKDAAVAYQLVEGSEPMVMVIVGENPHRTIAQARDLVQALTQAIAAAELASVQEVSQLCTHGTTRDDCPDCRH